MYNNNKRTIIISFIIVIKFVYALLVYLQLRLVMDGQTNRQTDGQTQDDS